MSRAVAGRARDVLAERSPTESLLADAPFLVNLAIWGAAVLWIFYFR